MSRVAVRFVPRAVPLDPVCVGGRGPVARALATRVLGNETTVAALRGVAGDELVLFLGESDSLPWVDGAFYLGRDPHAPLLLLPTQLAPDVPVDVFAAALLRHGAAVPPVAVLTDPPTLVSVADARSLDRGRVHAWLRERT